MTKDEILQALEGLKDYVNVTGRASIDAIKAAVWKLDEPAKEEPVLESEPVVEAKPEIVRAPVTDEPFRPLNVVDKKKKKVKSTKKK